MTNVIQFKTVREYDEPKNYKAPIDWSYEKAFVKGLFVWLAVGTVAGIFLPWWLTTLGLIVLCYADGKYKHMKETK